MSQTKERIPLHAARAEAERLMLLVGEHRTDHWTVAGSIRRELENVGDIEHVVIPRIGSVQVAREVTEGIGMFATTSTQTQTIDNVNLLWHRLDELLEAGTIEKARRADGATCWGNSQRALMLGGIRHEFYTATIDNLGPVTAIRTGPGDLSQHLVTVMKVAGYQCRNGFHVYPLGSDEKLSVPDEEEFFKICRVRFVLPRERDLLWRAIQRANWKEREASRR